MLPRLKPVEFQNLAILVPVSHARSPKLLYNQGVKNIFFNSSMPRSLSTLLQNILAQNPTIHSTPTDGSLELLFAARSNYPNSPEFKAQDKDLMLKAWRGFCWGGLQGYAEQLTDRPNVCIKSRGIGVHYQWYEAFFSQAGQKRLKVIVMVRDLRQVFSSMEKIFRSNQERHQEIQNHANMTGTSLEKRCDIWSNSQPIGLALERLQQCFRDGTAKHLLLIRAEDLAAFPDEEMRKIYNYLDLDYFEHNFDQVPQTTQEDDVVYGLSQSLHQIRPKVTPLKRDFEEILGTSVSGWVDQRFAWYQKAFGYI